MIEDDVSILQGVTLGGTGKETGDRHPKIRHGVLIGAGAKILGNIEIGYCARVAAGSVVLAPVPHNKTVAGVPARIVGEAGCAEPARDMNQILAEKAARSVARRRPSSRAPLYRAGEARPAVAAGPALRAKARGALSKPGESWTRPRSRSCVTFMRRSFGDAGASGRAECEVRGGGRRVARRTHDRNDHRRRRGRRPLVRFRDEIAGRAAPCCRTIFAGCSRTTS